MVEAILGTPWRASASFHSLLLSVHGLLPVGSCISACKNTSHIGSWEGARPTPAGPHLNKFHLQQPYSQTRSDPRFWERYE